MKQPLYQQIIDYLQNEIDSGDCLLERKFLPKELSAQFLTSVELRPNER